MHRLAGAVINKLRAFELAPVHSLAINAHHNVCENGKSVYTLQGVSNKGHGISA